MTATYSYDALGNRVGMGDATGVTAYAYDDLGRVLVLTHSVTTTVAYTVAYGYDGRGLRTLLTYPDGTRVTSTYDLAGRLTAVEGVTTTYAAYDYDAANRLISATLGNGVQSRYDYDAAGHMLAITHIQAGDLLARFAYTYDAVGNLTRAVETVVAENDGGPLGSELPEPPASPEPFRLYLPLVPRAPTAAVAERPAPGVAAVPPSFDPLAVPGGHPALEGSGAPIVREKQAYRASFDVQGLRYSPKERLVEAGAYYVDFHLVQVRSGQTKLFHPGSRQNPPSSPPGNPDLVRYDRGEYFREEYLVTAGGVEQRFVFPQPFPVDGDLEIEANLQGNLELVLQDTGEIAFLSPSGEVVSSYGRAIVEEACGERLVAALELHGAHLRIVVPQEWLERACFPVLVDPLIGLNFAVSTQPISGNQERTSVAYGGAGTYLAAWHGPGNGSDVFAQVLSAEGALVSETVTLDDRSGNQQYPDAAGNAAQGTYLVVWQHDAGMWLPNRDIYAQRVEHGGTLTGTRIAVYTGTYNQEYPAVAWNPNDDEYLVVWQSYNALTGLYGIYGQVIEESGGLSGTAQAIFTSTAQLAYPDVAFNVSDTQYLVLWQEYSSGGTGTPNWNVRGRIVAAAGTPTIAAFDVITASNDQTLPAATYSLSDTAYLVAWQHYSGTGDLNDVRARWIDRLGGLDDAFAVAAGSDDQRAPDVSYGAVWGESLVVWERQPNPGMMYWDVYGQRVSRSGSLVGGVVPVADGSMDQRYPAVAYSPETGEYLPAWQDYHSGSNWDVYAQRVDADGDLDGAEILVSAQPAAESQDAPAVAYGSAAGQHLVVWTDDRNGNDDIYGQFVADGGALVDEAFVIANASNYSEQSPAVAYDADDDEYLVVWSRRLPPLQNDTWNIYAQRVAGDGTLPSGILAICAASSDQTVPTVAYNAATGHFLVTWQDARGKGTFDVYARAVEGGSGTLGDEFLVYAGEEYQYAPAVAANAVDGEYVVVWQEGSGGDIYGQRTLTETTTEDAFAITTAAGDQQAPAVVFDAAAGAYLVAWADYRSGTSWDIYAQRVATDGLALGAVLAVATGPADQQDPAVAGNAATGEYAVAWQEGTGAEADVYGRLLGRGAELLGGVEVLCAADYTQEGPAVAAGGQGRFLAVWADYRSGTGDPDVAGQVATGYTVVVEYTYDGLYRLVGAAYNDGTGYAYSYDAVGNRLALTRTTQVVTLTTYSYDAADRLITVTRGGVATGYDWSDRGELLADGMQEYAWDAAGRLVGVSVTGGPEVTYVYDGANDRVALGVAGVTTTYVVDPLSPVDGVPQVLVATTGGASTRHLYGLDLLGQTQGITTTYLGYDALSVRLHLDEEGAIAAQYRYGPFGEVEGAEPEGYGYTGEQWHGDLDLLYLRARYYAPEVGRFVSRDEWPGTPASPASQHRFAYAQNNPVNHADPMGQWILLEEEGVLNAGTIWAQPYGVFGVRYDENGNLVILYGGYRFINWQEIAIANFINTCDTKWLIGGGGGSANAWVGWSVQDSAGQLGYYYRAKGIHPIYLSMIIMGAAASSPPPGWGGGIFYPEGLPPGADYSARVGYFETLWDAAARAAQAAAAPTQNNEPPQLIRGRIVEQIVRQRNGLPKNSTKVYATVDGKQRGTYPDSITATEVHEIKDVNEVYLSTQLKTEIQYAKDIGRTFVLHVRPNGLTTIYQPVIEAIQRAGGRIEYDVRP